MTCIVGSFRLKYTGFCAKFLDLSVVNSALSGRDKLGVAARKEGLAVTLDEDDSRVIYIAPRVGGNPLGKAVAGSAVGEDVNNGIGSDIVSGTGDDFNALGWY